MALGWTSETYAPFFLIRWRSLISFLAALFSRFQPLALHGWEQYREWDACTERVKVRPHDAQLEDVGRALRACL